MNLLLQGKTALVTGSGAGIGRGIALRFAAQGANVIVSDVNDAEGQETVDLIRAAQGEARYVHADVGEEDDVARLVKAAVESYGRLDVAVNNAGIEPDFVLMHEQSLSGWQKNLRVNLTGVFLCMKHELLQMREQRSGSIVNISSIAAIKSVPKSHVYAAAKRGVLSLTSSAAIENGALGIRVNAITPGGIMTRMMIDVVRDKPEIWESYKAGIPMGDAGQPSDIADAALYFASELSRYVTGQHFSVDGGITA